MPFNTLLTRKLGITGTSRINRLSGSPADYFKSLLSREVCNGLDTLSSRRQSATQAVWELYVSAIASKSEYETKKRLTHGEPTQLTALTQPTPEDLRKEIRKCRAMTKNPFGVNLTLLPALVPPDYAAYAQVIIDEGIKIVETAGNNPGPVIQQLKKANIIVLHKCTTIRHAKSAIKLGVDFLSIDGFECAGHVGENDITNFILLSRARQELKVPFIASGGFADGQGLAAAMALGAEGINMGTRFMCTVEAPIHKNVKEAIVKADETDTALVMRRWTNTTRLFGNKVSKEALKVERESKTGEFSEIAPFVSGKRGREVFLTGDVDFGVCCSSATLSPCGLRNLLASG